MSIEESLLSKSQFLGRDGFRWWIGQVAPRKVQSDQVNDGEAGFQNRYKVAIMGYHPYTQDLPDEDLPWAMCMLPTTAGGGGANYGVSTQLQQGDIVFGFFLDGDEGQVPCILGHFGRTTVEADDDEYEEGNNRFKPFTAYTDETPINPKTEPNKETGKPNQGLEQNKDVQTSNSSGKKGQYTDQNGSGQKIIAPDTCTPSSISRMAGAVEMLASRVEDFSLTGMKLEAEIDAVADLVETQTNGFVGRMMDGVYDWLEPQIQAGLSKKYDDTFSKVFAQFGNSPQSYAAAHSAGRSAQVEEIPNIKNAENALACVANKVVEGFRGTVADMLKDLLASGLGIAGCVAANFVGNVLNKLIDGIADGLKAPLSGLEGILGKGLDVADFLRSSAFLLEDFSGFLDCGQTNKDKCPPIKKYEVGGGAMEKGADPFNYVLGQMQGASKGLGGLTSGISGAIGGGGLLGAVTGIAGGGILGGAASGLLSGGGLRGALTGGLKSKFGNMIPSGVSKTLGSAGRISGLIDELSSGGGCVGGKQGCGNPQVEIFGGGGFGAIGKVVMGKVIENSGLSGVADGISRTANIIGVDLKVPGMNYKSPPAIRIADKCGIGYGAKGHSVLNEDGSIAAIVIDSVGTNYPVVTDPPINVGITTVFVETPGTGYTPGDKIDETVFVYPTGLPDSEGGDAPDTDTDPELIPDPYTSLVPEVDRPVLNKVTDKPVYELVVNPETGGIDAVRVLNILRFETPPVLKVLSKTGQGAVLRPVFGEIPEAVQTGVLTVIDCVGK
tara:strand:+ start:230 stop:2572 length:2343 start_codon:yes stop_codon:yes gene_type:complete